MVVRAAKAEVIGYQPQTVRPLADSSSCGGKLSTQRVTLNDGADGANPHHHAASAELFYVLGGSVQLLAGGHVLTAGKGTWPWCRRACCTHSRPPLAPTRIC
jgi:mannose-6-phosphate isomerase-like protein (cupin superfamily)